MTPGQLEREIARHLAHAKAFDEEGKRYARCGFPTIAARYRRMARDAAASAAEFVAMRTPETVAWMERERGLA